MDWLIKHFVNIYNLIKWFGTEAFRVAKDYFAAIWGIIAFLVGIAVVFWGIAVRLLNLVIEALSGLSIPTVDLKASSQVRDVLALANSVFPLDEFCGLFVVYCIVRVIILIYRLVKQWVPQIAGTGPTN